MPKFKCPYTYPARSREAMAKYIATGCGREYWGDHKPYPLHYRVKAYSLDLTFEHLWDRFAPEHFPSDVREQGGTVLERYKIVCRHEYDGLSKDDSSDTLWTWGVEEAWRSLNDGDTYRMLWSGAETYDVKFSLRGRSGGWLCIDYFEGYKLDVGADELYNQLNNPEEISFIKLRIFYMLARQWEVDFTGEKAASEIEYQAAFQFFVNVCERAWEHDKKERTERDAVVAAAKDVLAAIEEIPFPEMHRVREQYKLVTRAAGVLDADLAG
jgi:hypothetical protein